MGTWHMSESWRTLVRLRQSSMVAQGALQLAACKCHAARRRDDGSGESKAGIEGRTDEVDLSSIYHLK